MIVGLISDTHGLLRPQAIDALAGSDLIIHAGDIGGAHILDGLAELAPVTTVRGNVDEPAYLRTSKRNRLDPDWAVDVPSTADVTVEGVVIHVVHDLATLSPTVVADVVVVGHSHIPKVEMLRHMLLVNPGSAGPRRFRLPVSVGRLTVARGAVDVELVTLAV